jgi:hypothetical protein
MASTPLPKAEHQNLIFTENSTVDYGPISIPRKYAIQLSTP